MIYFEYFQSNSRSYPMKKSLLAIVVGAFAVASTANAGLYAEGD